MADQTYSMPKFDPDNPLPYGGTTDIHGNIIQAISKRGTGCNARQGKESVREEEMTDITIDTDLLFFAIEDRPRKKGPSQCLLAMMPPNMIISFSSSEPSCYIFMVSASMSLWITPGPPFGPSDLREGDDLFASELTVHQISPIIYNIALALNSQQTSFPGGRLFHKHLNKGVPPKMPM